MVFTILSPNPKKYEGKNSDFDLCEETANNFVKKHVDQYTAVLAMAHDPSIDDDAIVYALNSNAFYVGAIGSKKIVIREFYV